MAPRGEPPSAPGFREIDHSGDIGIEAWGDSRAELFANATRGLLGLMVWGRAQGGVSRRIEVRSSSAADLLVDWLAEVILAAATHGEVYGDVSMERAGETSAAGVLRGAVFAAGRHERRFDVKAATYHDLLCEESAGRYHARVIFDL